MKAYTVVGPTKLQPCFLRSLDKAMDSADVVIARNAARVTCAGRVEGSGSQRQKYAASEPQASRSCKARCALLITDSIFPRWRTMPASSSRRDTSRSSKRAMASMSKLANPARKASRLFRMVSQLKPLWKPSRQIFSNSRRSSATGNPHSVSW